MSADDTVDDRAIRIPPNLIPILREYTKAVIRSQPDDLLKWSSLYFRALSQNQSPDVEKRLLFFGSSAGGLSQAVLRLLHLKFRGNEYVFVRDLKSQWDDMGLDLRLLTEMLKRAGISEDDDSEVAWLKILALAIASCTENLMDTMKKFCEIAGDTSWEHNLSYKIFKKPYIFLAELDGISSIQIQHVLEYFSTVAEKQKGMVNTENFKDPNCPHL